MLRSRFARGRKGAVSVLFASSVIAMLMMVGLSVDYSFYNEAQTQLNMAADSASIHAVRMAVQAVLQQQSNYVAQGVAAGQQWFIAQAGNVTQAKYVDSPTGLPTVTVSFSSATNLMTATVNYTGLVTTHFGGLFPVKWQNWPNWGIAGSATAVESTQTFIEFDMLLDNSSSMLIAATSGGIAQMNAATPCSAAAATAGQGADSAYSWYYNKTTSYGGPNNNSSTKESNATTTTYIPYGYGTFTYTARSGTVAANELIPPTTPVTGECNPSFTGSTTAPTNQCAYIASMTNIITKNGYAQCASASGTITGGGPGYYNINNVAGRFKTCPQAPCAFCLPLGSRFRVPPIRPIITALRAKNGIQLRFDVVQTSAASVVQSLINYLPSSPVPGAVPYRRSYTFNTALGTLYSSPIWPITAATETLELNTAMAGHQQLSDTGGGRFGGYRFSGLDGDSRLDAEQCRERLDLHPGAEKTSLSWTDGMQDYNAATGPVARADHHR